MQISKNALRSLALCFIKRFLQVQAEEKCFTFLEKTIAKNQIRCNALR